MPCLFTTVIQGRACLRALWACSYICSGEPSRGSGDCEEKASMRIGLNKSPRASCSGQNLQCHPAPEKAWKSHTLPTDPLMQQDSFLETPVGVRPRLKLPTQHGAMLPRPLSPGGAECRGQRTRGDRVNDLVEKLQGAL